MSLFKKLLFAVDQQNKRTMLNYLKTLPASEVDSMGFSRELMAHGANAWPWREDNLKQELVKVDQMMAKEKKDIAELQAYTDAELHDIGISRGTIVHAVRNGRPGIEAVAVKRAA